MKWLIKLAIILVSLALLLPLALSIYLTLFFDINSHRGEIEAIVEDNSNLKLSINGDLSLSVFPNLAVNIGQLDAELIDENQQKSPFASLKHVVVDIALWPILTGKIAANAIRVEGLELHLEKDQGGKGNWESVVSESGETETPPDSDSSTAETEETSAPAIALNVNAVDILAAAIHYKDLASEQEFHLEAFNLHSEDLNLTEAFPLSIDFQISTKNPDIHTQARLNGDVLANLVEEKFALSAWQLQLAADGEVLPSAVEFTGGWTLEADLKQQTANIQEFQLAFDTLSLTTSGTVTQLLDAPQFDTKLALALDDIRGFLTKLSLPIPETTDPTALKQTHLSLEAKGNSEHIDLDALTIALDETQLTGNASFEVASTGVRFELTGDKINLDRYLPSSSEESQSETATGAETEASPGSSAAASEEPLLPNDVLRTLNLEGKLTFSELIASQLSLTNLLATVKAQEGIIKVDHLDGNFYQGSFAHQIVLNAQQEAARISLEQQIKGIQIQPMLLDLQKPSPFEPVSETQEEPKDLIAGAVNITTSITTSGVILEDYRQRLNGSGAFEVAEGEIKMNLLQPVCYAFAQINGDNLSTEHWPTVTPFNRLNATYAINQGVLNSEDLIISLLAMELTGKGSVDLVQEGFDWTTALTITGDTRDQACLVEEKFRNIPWPVRCKGQFSDEPSELCRPDTQAMRKTMTALLKNEAKRKAQKEIERAINKNPKIKELTDKLQGGDEENPAIKELGDKLKKGLRGLFGDP